MANVNASAQLPASPEQVWDVLADFGKFEQWLTIHQGWKSELPTELGVGTKVTQIVSIMGMANKIEWNVDEYSPPKALRISGTGMAGVEVAFTLAVEPAAEGATATIDAEFTGQMIVGALGTAVEQNSKKELDASLEKLAGLFA